ncbi:MAG: hypothetical protein KJS97_00110 [Alphaproteobacteria bacterium]|nr:hypothetical protein [Alphaproteobacteria bacterium]
MRLKDLQGRGGSVCRSAGVVTACMPGGRFSGKTNDRKTQVDALDHLEAPIVQTEASGAKFLMLMLLKDEAEYSPTSRV